MAGEVPEVDNRIAATVEACRLELMKRIVTGKDALQSQIAHLAAQKSLNAEQYSCYKVWEMRSKKLREQYMLDKAITKHLVATRGDIGDEEHHQQREGEAESRKKESEQKAARALSLLLSHRAEIAREEKAMKTLTRVLEGWESNFDARVQNLLSELRKPAASDREALQNAGFVCICTDVNCRFPLVVDEKHYAGFWGA